MNVAAALNEAFETLQRASIVEYRREASSLLAFALKRPSSFIVAHPEYELDADEQRLFKEIVYRRSRHEPFQHITRRQEFYGLEFEVTPDVLIPRPETEHLVEAAIEVLMPLDTPRFCEVGVGSGCIAVSVLHEVPTATATAGDISTAALRIAEANAATHGVRGRLELVESDVFSAISGPFALIVSNPPYIPREHEPDLQAEVRDFEPSVALFGGPGGLELIRRIVDQAPDHLHPGGRLLMEIGFSQSESVLAFFDPDLWQAPKLRADLQGIPRVVAARPLARPEIACFEP